MVRKPKRPVTVRSVELGKHSPDFSKLKCERPLPDVDTILQRAKDDEDAEAIYQLNTRQAGG